jgi:hypothetical protein
MQKMKENRIFHDSIDVQNIVANIKGQLHVKYVNMKSE